MVSQIIEFIEVSLGTNLIISSLYSKVRRSEYRHHILSSKSIIFAD